jgi:hypothetical protein
VNTYSSDSCGFDGGIGERCPEQDLEVGSLFVLSVHVRQSVIEVRGTEYGGILVDVMTLARKRDPSSLAVWR